MLSGPSLSDDRGSAQPGQPPYRPPAHGTPRTARGGPALAETAEPRAQRGTGRLAHQGERQPYAEIHRDQRPRAGCAGPATPGCGPPCGGRPRAGRARSSDGAGRGRSGSRSSSRRRAPARPDRSPRARRRTPPAAGRPAAMTAVRTALAPPRKVVTRELRIGSEARSRGTCRRWRDAGLRVGDPEADDAEPRVGREGPADQLAGVRRRAAARRRRGRAARPRRGRRGRTARCRRCGRRGCRGSPAVRRCAGPRGSSAAAGRRCRPRATSIGAPCCLATESSRSCSSAGRLPMVMTTAPTRQRGAHCEPARREDATPGAAASGAAAMAASTTTASRVKNRSPWTWSTTAAARISSDASMPPHQPVELQRRGGPAGQRHPGRARRVGAPP